MSSRLTTLALCGLAAAALAGCGSGFAPVAGSAVPAAATTPLGRGVVDQAREPYYTCIRAAGLPVTKVGYETLQVGTLPSGPTIHFASDPPAAEYEQMNAGAYPQAQGAENIGAALLYVHGAPDSELATIEGCLDQHVKG